jgi:hypothetical protein
MPGELRLDSARLRTAYEYWDERRAGRTMPARADVDPSDIPALLPFVILTDVLCQDPLEFRYRLIGTAICDRIKRDYTGWRLMDLPHQRPGSVVWDTRARCVETRAPVFDAALPYVGSHVRVRNVRQLHLPLSADGSNVNIIFTVVEFDEALP